VTMIVFEGYLDRKANRDRIQSTDSISQGIVSVSQMVVLDRFGFFRIRYLLISGLQVQVLCGSPGTINSM
jgi:hypothetical protein